MAKSGRPVTAKQEDLVELKGRVLTVEEKVQRYHERLDALREEVMADIASLSPPVEHAGKDDPHSFEVPDDAEIKGGRANVTLNVGGRQVTRSVSSDIAHRVHQQRS